MNDGSKIRLSGDELDTLQERLFFERKKIITEKIYHLFAELIRETKSQKIFSAEQFPAHADIMTGKISKGENYLGLPYLILDFPRFFGNPEIVAVRTMVWWGNLISCTLLISGVEMSGYRKAVLKNFPLLKREKTLLCVHDSAWHHHFEKDNFLLLSKLGKKKTEEIMQRTGFLKLARKIPARKINKLIPFSLESFHLFAKILRHQGVNDQ